MKPSLKEKSLWLVIVLALVAVLAVLAFLQYRWSEEVNDAASDRMRAGLQSSMIGMRDDLARELTSITYALELDSGSENLAEEADAYVEKLEAWKRTSSHPDLVTKIYLWRDNADRQPQFYELDIASRKFHPSNLPPPLSEIERPMQAMSADLLRFASMRADDARHARGLQNFRAFPGPRPFNRPTLPWMIYETLPGLFHPEVSNQQGEGASRRLTWVIVQLNPKTLQQQILPELAQRYFGGSSGLVYDVAVLSRLPERHVIYTSNTQFGQGEHIPTDGRLNLFGPVLIGPIGAPMGANYMTLPRPEAMPGGGGRPFPRDWRGMRRGLLRLEAPGMNGHDGNWELIVRHRKGSLEAAIAALHHRHLAISFGVLLVLAATMAMIVAAARRAQRLAQLQMNFVAGVSHELRTPLAVISSAAENIADGIVEDRKKVVRYGTVIRNQSRQLSQLVEQLLLFAATRQDRYQYTATDVSVGEVIETALNNSAELIHAAGFTVEQNIAADLPSIVVDIPAVCHCLQNLIANAVKYGGERRWIGIHANTDYSGNRREVLISVEDHGIGIDPADLKRIFDPFYRSPEVVAAQIHGTGIGLALAKGIAEGMGGTITVTSKPGDGSTFTLHLPCVEKPNISAEQKAMGAAIDSNTGNA